MTLLFVTLEVKFRDQGLERVQEYRRRMEGRGELGQASVKVLEPLATDII